MNENQIKIINSGSRFIGMSGWRDLTLSNLAVAVNTAKSNVSLWFKGEEDWSAKTAIYNHIVERALSRAMEPVGRDQLVDLKVVMHDYLYCTETKQKYTKLEFMALCQRLANSIWSGS